MQTTFVMIKPDGVSRGLVGKILQRYEEKGLQLRAAKLMEVPKSLAKAHYCEHKAKPFFPALIEYITSGPVFAMILGGDVAIDVVRLINGATKVEEALPGTIRGDFASSTAQNIVHASDSPESAKREISLWFPELDTTSSSQA